MDGTLLTLVLVGVFGPAAALMAVVIVSIIRRYHSD
jgi:hypothetical protein